MIVVRCNGRWEGDAGVAPRAPGAGARPAPAAPHVRLRSPVDDYVVQLQLPGGVVHNFSVAQAQAFADELVDVIARADALAAHDRRAHR